MLNPKYKSRINKKRFPVDDLGLDIIYCPNCKKPIMEGRIETVYTRCKFCKVWVLLIKKDSFN